MKTMKVTVLNRKKNPVMEREEVVLLVEHEGKSQPSRKELEQVILAELGKKKEVVALKRIQSIFGTPVSRIFVNVYKSAEKKKYFEPAYLLKKEEKQNTPEESEHAAEKSA
jgi:small subunit ribosomal protein S24e